jgi:dihydroflavonol-4-reductase
MPRAFVTGATGFVGSALVRELLDDGVQVRVLIRATSDLGNLANMDVERVQGDVMDEQALAVGLRGCDVVYHVAAFYSTREEDASLMYEVNVQGTKRVLRLALEAGAGKIVHTSTIGTIGRPDDGSLPTEETEFNLWDTASHYARSKYMGETEALSLGESGLPVVVVNPCAPVGPRDIKPSSTGQRIVDYLRGKTPSFVPGGINFVAVEDVARGHILAAERGIIGRRYILGNLQGNLLRPDFIALMHKVSGVAPPGTSKKGVVSRAGRLVRRSLRSRSVPPMAAGRRPEALICDPSRAVRELGLPQTPLEVAFARAVDWFRGSGYV